MINFSYQKINLIFNQYPKSVFFVKKEIPVIIKKN